MHRTTERVIGLGRKWQKTGNEWQEEKKDCMYVSKGEKNSSLGLHFFLVRLYFVHDLHPIIGFDKVIRVIRTMPSCAPIVVIAMQF